MRHNADLSSVLYFQRKWPTGTRKSVLSSNHGECADGTFWLSCLSARWKVGDNAEEGRSYKI